MATISGGLLISGNILFGGLYSTNTPPKAISPGYLISGNILFADGSYVASGSKVFSSAFNIGGSGVFFSDNYVKLYNTKTYTTSALISPSARPGASGDTGFLIVIGFYTDFEGSPRSVVADEDGVQFTDYTYGPDIKSWLWDFGDGQTSSEQSPIHFYSTGGVYTVSLTVTSVNDEQAYLSKENYITVTEKLPGTLKIYPVATNQRVTAYRSGSDDKLQIKVQLFGNNKTGLSYLKDVPLMLKLNFSGWQPYETDVTDATGSQIIYHSCQDITSIDNCLGYVVATIDNKTYKSNIVRFNFV